MQAILYIRIRRGVLRKQPMAHRRTFWLIAMSWFHGSQKRIVDARIDSFFLNRYWMSTGHKPLAIWVQQYFNKMYVVK